MRLTEALKEAERVMTICNACRYCEGYCAVYPAMELRRTFSEQDLKYLANLCHNCRGCYYACQYAPPHEFSLNVPKSLAELRLEIYQAFVRPGFLAGAFQRNGMWVAMISSLCIIILLLLLFFFQTPSVVFSLLIGSINLWYETGGQLGELIDLRANWQAIKDVLQLKYMDGGGHGCNYPDDQFSMGRRWFHHCVFYGFLLCFTATTIAAIYDHFLDLSAPYPILSWPVMLGAAGGVALLIGTGGLLFLKRKMDTAPATHRALGMDVAFLVQLFFASLTGLLLLILRETPAMGTLLAVHLGVVAGLFITMPYGKFVHAVYRYAALVRNGANSRAGEVNSCI
jgi:citrate/tricarballylate utilization protein